jgi:hypothetical protein
MSVFNKIIEAHALAKSEAEHKAAAAIAARSTAQAEFAAAFKQQVESVAAPIFQQFVNDALGHGFPATVELGSDGQGNPMYSLRFRPEKGTQLGTNPASECAYTMRGTIADQKVEHAYYFEQRPEKKSGMKKGVFGIQSINAAVLERELGAFLSATLAARAA